MTDEDKFKVLDNKIKELESTNDRLEAALTNITEALMIIIEREENMSKPDITGPGFLANN